MARYDACLIDVYDTVLTADMSAEPELLAEIAGIPADEFRKAAGRIAARVNVGECTMADATREILAECGTDPGDDVVREIVAADQAMLTDVARLEVDTVPFLDMLRARHVPSAFVSNCAENTRRLLADLGLDTRVDAIVLSCETGTAKPSPAIYREALAQLGARPATTLFVDDKPSYCEGARALGMDAAQISRDEFPPRVNGGTFAIRSLLELEPFF